MYDKMFGEDKLHEECGVVGVYSEKPEIEIPHSQVCANNLA
jgi:hypothetical protein